jgi:hypothetical protein
MIACSLSLNVNGVPVGGCLRRAYTGYPVDTVPVGEIPVTLVTHPRVSGCLSVNCWNVCVATKLRDEAPVGIGVPDKWNFGTLYDYADEDFALDLAIYNATTYDRWNSHSGPVIPVSEGEIFTKTISGFDSPGAFTAAARALMKDPAKSYFITGTCLVPNDLQK